MTSVLANEWLICEGMTESHNPEYIDLFFRQGLIGGNRVPVIWSPGGNFDLFKLFHEQADVDVGEYGSAMDGIPEVESKDQAETIPWAARYLKCKDTTQEICDSVPRFCASCWIDREDGIKPEKDQLARPKGQVKWHPGWRFHQLQGRALAVSVLQALQAAVNIWSEGVMGKEVNPNPLPPVHRYQIIPLITFAIVLIPRRSTVG